MGKTAAAQLDPKRRKAILWALKVYSAEDVCKADRELAKLEAKEDPSISFACEPYAPSI